MNSPVIQLAIKLINRASVTPDDAGCQRILMNRLQAMGFSCESMPSAGVSNLWSRYGSQAPLFVFAGHTDVVPPGPLTDWLSPPFQATLHHNGLYGRGATDMKGALAAMVCATEQFIQAHPVFPGSIAFLITSNEEGYASDDGTKVILERLQQRNINIDYALVGEASSDKKVGDQIRIGRRGSLQGQLRVYGKQGHVAFPTLARNPIHLSALAIHELAHLQWDQGNDYFPPTSLQMTNLHSGISVTNVIPGHLDMAFNFRFSTATTVQTLQATVVALLERHHLKFDIDWLKTAEPFLSRPGRLLKVVQQAIQQVTQRMATLSTGGGTSDARFIAQTGTEVLELGVPYESAHQVNEYVQLDDLEGLNNIYYSLLKLLFNKID